MEEIPIIDKRELTDWSRRIMWNAVEYREYEMVCSCAMREIKTKFEVLDAEFDVKHRRNPISSIQTRLKSLDSVIRKLRRLELEPNLDNIKNHVHDMAGVRVICSYIDDIYAIAASFLAQDDITLIARKDYISSPKFSGYRSLHLIVGLPVFFSDHKRYVTAEVQIRTVAMDFWATLEHQMRYKNETNSSPDIIRELRECADVIASTDLRMMELRDRVEAQEDIATEDDILLERMRRFRPKG